MKRKELLAKSLAVGLAVAMAASSMSTPGGLLAPIEVMAAGTLSEDGTYFTVEKEVVLPESGSVGGDDVVTVVSGKEEAVGEYEVTFQKDGGDAAPTVNEAGTYDVLVKITAAGTGDDGLEATGDSSTKVGTVKIYEPFKGTASITSTGDVSAPKAGDTLTVEVTGGDDAQAKTYQWYRGDSETIADANSASYTLTGTDVGKIVSVKISSETGVFQTQELKLSKEAALKDFEGTPTAEFAKSEGKLTVTVTLDQKTYAANELEYCTDGGAGNQWEAVPDTGIDLGNKSYEKNAIQVRVKATDDTAASAVMPYGEEILAALKGTASITGDAKYGATLTAGVTENQDDAELVYQFGYVDGDTFTEFGEGSSENTYKVKAADIDKVIGVKVWATNYSGALAVAKTANAIGKADARTITLGTGTQTVVGEGTETPTYTYTVNATKDNDAEGTLQYAAADGADGAEPDTGWQDSPEFSGLVPGQGYKFYVRYSPDDAVNGYYDEGASGSKSETFEKLDRAGFDFEATVTDGSTDGSKVVTIKKPFDGAVCKIDGEALAESDGVFTKTYDSVTDANKNITISVEYPSNERYKDTGAVTKTMDISKESYADPDGAAIGFTVSADKRTYTAVVTPPAITEGTLEYSTDGCKTWSETLTAPSGLGAGDSVKVYVRVKGSDKNTSNAVAAQATAPAASTTPSISITASTNNETTATISGTGELRYTVGDDPADPDKDSTRYEGTPITVASGQAIKAIAIEDGKIMSAVASQTFTPGSSGGDNTGGSASGGSGSSGGSSSGGSSSGTSTSTPKTETKPDGTVVTTTESKKADGTIVTTTEEKKTDGSTTTTTEEKKTDGSTVKTTEEKKADGSTVKAVEEKKADGTSVTTTTEQNKDGSTKTAVEEKKADGSATTKTDEKKADGTTVSGVEEKKADGSATAKVSVENKDAGVQATVNVKKDTKGKVTDATAQVTQVAPDKTPVVSATTVNQIAAAAGTKNVVVTQKVVDADGNTVCNVTVDLSDLSAGNDMKVLKINKKTGEKSLINKSVYTVNEDGSVVLADLKKANYVLVTASEENAFSKQVLKTVKVKQSKKSVTAGKKTKIALSDKLNMDNVAKVTYTTSKKSVATVNKNGTVKAKKAGKVTVKAKVTLKNGKTKTVKMTLTVKKKK